MNLSAYTEELRRIVSLGIMPVRTAAVLARAHARTAHQFTSRCRAEVSEPDLAGLALVDRLYSASAPALLNPVFPADNNRTPVRGISQ